MTDALPVKHLKMSEGTPKPFACTSEGCTMTFTNEDHLNVHQRKHEMVLNLGLKSSSIVADQTPTPTRFLRNCEEVGLFQDLQNVNPFEETFKKAVEMVKTGSLPVPDLPEDDSLHTPHIFPLPENAFSQIKTEKIQFDLTVETKKELTVDKNDSVSTSNSNNNPEYILSTNDKNPKILINDKPSVISSDKKAVFKSKLVIREKKFAKIAQKPIYPNISPKEKLQQILQTKQMQDQSPQPSVILFPVLQQSVLSKISTVPIMRTVPIVQKAENINLKSNKAPKTSPKKQNDEIIDKRKLDILERNRAAAIRSRARKREWIYTLESKFNAVCRKNETLEKENTSLRNEVHQLKALLLAHKECPVTKAMDMGQSIPVGIQIRDNKIKTETSSQKKEFRAIRPNIPKPSVIVMNETILS